MVKSMISADAEKQKGVFLWAKASAKTPLESQFLNATFQNA